MIDLSFLKANRFWALIIAAILSVLKAEGILDASIADALIGLCAAFIGIRTVDRFGEKVAVQ